MYTKLRERIAQLALFRTLAESIILSLAFVILFYFASSDIAIQLDSYHDIVLLFLAFITLYNGTLHGIISLVVITSSIYFFTLEYQTITILEYLVFVLLFGEFHYRFTQKGRKDHEEKNYLKAKFRELSNAFFALKVSHDQLEKGYLLRPVTLRSLILDLSKKLDQKEIYHHLFETFTEAFALKSAVYFRFSPRHELPEAIPLGESVFQFDPDHPLIAQTLEDHKAHFLAEEQILMQQQEPVLAVLPIRSTQDDLLGLFVIEEMDFLEFNIDNILKIQILLEYLAQEHFYSLQKSHHATRLTLADLDARFIFEVERLYNMYTRFGVHSALVAIYTQNDAVSLTLENFKAKKMRLLDMVAVHRYGNHRFYLFLLPLERASGAVSFKKRLETDLMPFPDSDYQILITEIDRIDTLQQWIELYEK